MTKNNGGMFFNVPPLKKQNLCKTLGCQNGKKNSGTFSTFLSSKKSKIGFVLPRGRKIGYLAVAYWV
jgi:hypothetical protein